MRQFFNIASDLLDEMKKNQSCMIHKRRSSVSFESWANKGINEKIQDRDEKIAEMIS